MKITSLGRAGRALSRVVLVLLAVFPPGGTPAWAEEPPAAAPSAG